MYVLNLHCNQSQAEHLEELLRKPGDGDRLDIATNRLLAVATKGHFFNVTIFNSYAPSNYEQCCTSIYMYRKREKLKIRVYEQCLCEVDHSSFTPLTMSIFGGCGHATNICCDKLVSLL